MSSVLIPEVAVGIEAFGHLTRGRPSPGCASTTGFGRLPRAVVR